MNLFRFSLIIYVIFYSNFSAQDTITTNTRREMEMIRKNGVWEKPVVQMKKHWISSGGDYLFMYSNVYNPHGDYCLDYFGQKKCVGFEGSQTGNSISFKGFNPESFYRPIMEFSGNLDEKTNILKGKWKELNGKNNPDKSVVFKPLNNLKPIDFSLKIFVTKINYSDYISKIKVEFPEKTQILENFAAISYSKDIFLEDLNFDGYQDIFMNYRLNVDGKGNEFMVFWLYNPAKKQFEPSEFLNKQRVELYQVNAVEKTMEVSRKNRDFTSSFYMVNFVNGKPVSLKKR